jgi:hypothetical protein
MLQFLAFARLGYSERHLESTDVQWKTAGEIEGTLVCKPHFLRLIRFKSAEDRKPKDDPREAKRPEFECWIAKIVTDTDKVTIKPMSEADKDCEQQYAVFQTMNPPESEEQPNSLEEDEETEEAKRPIWVPPKYKNSSHAFMTNCQYDAYEGEPETILVEFTKWLPPGSTETKTEVKRVDIILKSR